MELFCSTCNQNKFNGLKGNHDHECVVCRSLIQRKCPYCLQYFSRSNTTHLNICNQGPKRQKLDLNKHFQVRIPPSLQYSSFQVFVDQISPSIFYYQYQICGLPCVINRNTSVLDWNLQYLKEKLPKDTEVFVKKCEKAEWSDTCVSLDEFVEQRIYSDIPLYGMDIGLKGTDLEREILIPSIFKENMLDDARITCSFLVAFVGGPGTYCGLHIDTCNIHSYIWLLSGTKLYYVFPPESMVDEIFGHGYHFPPIIEKDLKEKIEKLSGKVIEVHAGEIIFIPSGWWHAATNISDTIAWGNSIINFSNIKAVISCHENCQKEFDDVGLDINQLLTIMVERANSIEEIGILLDSLQNSFEDLKEELKEKIKRLIK